MSPVPIVLHLRTGEPGLAGAVDDWLRKHAVQSTGFANVYEACVHLLEHTADVPDLVFVGADWLAPAEATIIRYVRETWPGAGIIVYVSGKRTIVLESGALQCVCRSGGALQQLLSQSPEQVLRRLRQQTASGEPPVVPASPLKRDTRPARSGPVLPEDVGVWEACPPGRPQASAPRTRSPRRALTDEELAALWGQTDRL